MTTLIVIQIISPPQGLLFAGPKNPGRCPGLTSCAPLALKDRGNAVTPSAFPNGVWEQGKGIMTDERQLVRGPSTALGLAATHGQRFLPRSAQDDGLLKCRFRDLRRAARDGYQSI